MRSDAGWRRRTRRRCVRSSATRHARTIGSRRSCTASRRACRFGCGWRKRARIEEDRRMVIRKIALPRRTFIRGMGATLALPLLDRMGRARWAQSSRAAAPGFVAVYCGNGANMNDWTPPTEGVGFDLSPILNPLEPFRDRTIVFTGLDNFPATDQGDSGGQHPRAAPAFMSSVHPKQTEGADVQAGTTIDQIIEQQICRGTNIPSLELAVDRNDVVGACDH